MKKYFVIFFITVIGVLSCSKERSSQIVQNVETTDHEGKEVLFYAGVVSSTGMVTKAPVVTSLPSFHLSATSGTGASETLVWDNVTFTKVDGSETVYRGNKWWQTLDPEGVHFFASNLPLSHDGHTVSVSASNATDVVCAYLHSPVYYEPNDLLFEHIFARTGVIEVNSKDGYEISDVTITITPKTGGTYDLRAGYGQSDGTGWGDVVTAPGPSTLFYRQETIGGGQTYTQSSGEVANIFLVPGEYRLTASWTATKDVYTESFTDKTADVELVAGCVNNISCHLGGEATDISFGVSVADWGSETLDIGNYPFVNSLPSFGGLNIAPAPLYYDGTSFVIKDDDWNHDSLTNNIYGKTEGSYYFNFVELGQYFDSEGSSFSTYSGDIDNANKISYGDYEDWRLPTLAEWYTFTTGQSPGTSRTGSKVNGNSGAKYAIIELYGVTHAGRTPIKGLLLFPDGKTITGKILSNINKSGSNSLVVSELNAYLEQGCVFLPDSSYFTTEGSQGSSREEDHGGRYWAATSKDSNNAYFLFIYRISHQIECTTWFKSDHYSVRLVRSTE